MFKRNCHLQIIIALLFSIILPFSVSAATSRTQAGIYGFLRGTSTQSGSILSVTGTVSYNPDNAYITTNAVIYSNVGSTDAGFHYSSRGVCTYTYGYPLYISLDSTPISANCSVGIQGGTQSDGFVTYTFTLFSF